MDEGLFKEEKSLQQKVIDLNPAAFRPYPAIKSDNEIWSSEFPKPSSPLHETASLEEQSKAYRMDYFDWKNAVARETMIYIEETKLWREKFNKCRESSGINKNELCRGLEEICNERAAYIGSKFSLLRYPKLSPGLVDLGPPPSPPNMEPSDSPVFTFYDPLQKENQS